MTRRPGSPVTIAIPVFGTPPALLVACLRSIEAARGEADESFVVVDGPQSTELEAVISSASARGFEVIRQASRLGLVGNWNECLKLGSHELVHVMHADDTIDPAFYLAVCSAMRGARVAVVAAGSLPTAPGALRPAGEAARYLLSHQKPATGSFVLRRSALGAPARGFDARFPYCPDEELFLRVLASGELALVEPNLYVESRHPNQARFSTWHRPDFADVYYTARIEGARAVGPDVVPVARRQTSRRLLSVGRFLCGAGQGRAARAIVRSITAHDKRSLVDWKYWALLVLATVTREGRPSLVARVAAPSNGSASNP